MLRSCAVVAVCIAAAVNAGATWRSTEAGDGTSFASNGMVATVHYTGKIVSTGKVFDTTKEEGEPVDFVVGTGEVLKCWDEAFPKLSAGEKGVLSCTPDVAYGSAGAPPQGIPGDAEIEFEVELVSVKENERKPEPDLDQSGYGADSSDPENMFPGMDKDKNGQLDSTELDNAKFKQGLQLSSMGTPHLLIEMDTDKDGVVSEDEFLIFVWATTTRNQAVNGFKANDRNKDGSLSFDEYKQTGHAFQFLGSEAVADAKREGKEPDYMPGFKSLDADQDGKLTEAEIVAIEGASWMSRCDTNGDGQASKAEWEAFAKINHVKDANDDTFTAEVFDKLDKNKDEMLPPSEYHAGMQQLAADMLAQGYGGGDL